MKTIGLTGGSALCELGSAIDVQLFFNCLDAYVVQRHLELDWTLLTDRLYRRYLRLEELDTASTLMDQAKQTFLCVNNRDIDWQVAVESTTTRLDMSKRTLAEIFDKFFESYSHCSESAKMNHEAFKSYPGYKYEAVRLVVADQPWFLLEKRRPLEDYDALDGLPFWLR